MRRWLAIFMLVLLPLQFSWAAVAEHCGHETDQQTQHLGHHDNQHASHAGVDQDRDAETQDGQAAGDFDGCGHCHGNCCSMPAPAHSLCSRVITSLSTATTAGIVRTLASNPPERPQWLRFA